MAVSTLKVVQNKWATVDRQGRPMGVCQVDPKAMGGAHDFLGMDRQVLGVEVPKLSEEAKMLRAVRRARLSQKMGGAVLDQIAPSPEAPAKFGVDFGPGTLMPKGVKERVAFSYQPDTTVLEVDNTNFYRERIRHGDLFAFDQQTYKAVFSTVKGFEDAAELLERARVAALRGCGIDPHATPEQPADSDASTANETAERAARKD